jgi:phosphatidylglycerophosphatase C
VTRTVALFDFDHTLITGDSFWPFLMAASGRGATAVALGGALTDFARHRLRAEKTESLRTFVKGILLRRLVAGRSPGDFASAAEHTRQWQTENPAIMRRLRAHHAAGDIVVIASGGLDLYLPALLRDVPHHALICTEIGIENGILTGAMINGNCVRLKKAERVRDWLATNGPFDESFAYGNYPHDLPMMELVRHRIIV